jgi:small subunit ribosomal protein S19e
MSDDQGPFVAVRAHPLSPSSPHTLSSSKMAEYEPRGITVRDVGSADFIAAYALHLKNSDKFELPKWTDVVKTGTNKELAPYDPDWYYTRAAAIARKVYLQPGLGVGALTRKFGGAKNRGTRTFTFGNAAKGVIRNILQQLEEIKVMEISENGGRVISRVGQQDLDRIAGQVNGGPGDDGSDDDSDSD